VCCARARSQSVAQFKDAPLYLEWAPLGVFTNPRKAATNAAPERAPEAATAAEAEEGGGGSTLFVKNLNFETTERKLRALFEEIGARVAGRLR
jgi:multiple RNA-binding domain-containing protein 1